MNEVSKLGQPEEPEEVIEGRIVPDYAGPGFNAWDYIDAAVRDMYRYGSYHFIVDEDGIHPTAQAYKVDRMQVFINGEWTNVSDVPDNDITYERGPSFDNYWTDEIQNWQDRYPQTVEFTSDDISDETFRLMTGYDRNVLIAATKLGTQAPVPPVDPDRVKWPS